MLHVTTRILPAIATALAIGAASPALAAGPVMLTVTGTVENANRGPVDPDYDKLFAFNDVSFDEAREFDLEALYDLQQVTVRADFPKDGELVEFTGPLLEDVLAVAGARGDIVTVRAMDGYAVEAPVEEMIASGAVVALARDGKPLGIGDFGPAQIVFPRADRDELSDMSDDWWIWQVYHIKVE